MEGVKQEKVASIAPRFVFREKGDLRENAAVCGCDGTNFWTRRY